MPLNRPPNNTSRVNTLRHVVPGDARFEPRLSPSECLQITRQIARRSSREVQMHRQPPHAAAAVCTRDAAGIRSSAAAAAARQRRGTVAEALPLACAADVCKNLPLREPRSRRVAVAPTAGVTAALACAAAFPPAAGASPRAAPLQRFGGSPAPRVWLLLHHPSPSAESAGWTRWRLLPVNLPHCARTH